MAYDEALAARVRDLLEGEPGITEKRMFGGLAFLVDGHMSVAAGGKGYAIARRYYSLQGEAPAGPCPARLRRGGTPANSTCRIRWLAVPRRT